MLKIKWRFKFMKDKSLFIVTLSIYKSFDWNYFFHRMIVEIIFNNEIPFFSNQFIVLGEKNICVHYQKNCKFKL
jgi:hypothetical protein